MIVATFAAAIACFGIAAIPLTRVPWQPAINFVAQRRVEASVLGVAFLLWAGFLLLLRKVT